MGCRDRSIGIWHPQCLGDVGGPKTGSHAKLSAARRPKETPPMARGGDDARKQIVELLQGRPGWRLEPRTTPGASPLWCFLAEGKVVFSVTAEGASIHLYEMDSDREV